MKKLIIISIFLFSLLFCGVVFARMTGGDYEIPVDSFSVVEGGVLTGGDYELKENVGDFGSKILSSADYILYGGFFHSSAGSLSFSLDQDTLNLGQLSLDSIAADTLTATVDTTSDTGYTVSLSEDSNLSSGANDIDDVADGEVTAGHEEYGIKTDGGDGQLAVDTAIDGTVVIASRDNQANSIETDIIFSAAIGGSSLAGDYSHTVTFSITVNP